MSKRVKKMVLVCYLLCAALWLTRGCFWLFYEGGREPVRLDAAKAERVQLEETGAGRYLTLGGDGQFLFENLVVSGGRLWLNGTFGAYPGELDLYYKKTDQQDYSVRQRVFARPLEAGGYEYLIPPGEYGGLRLDTGMTAENTLKIKEIVLHEQRPFYAYFILSFRGWVAFLILPALASCVIYTIMEGYLYWKNRRAKPPAERGSNE